MQMPFGFGKKDRDGRRGRGKDGGSGRRFGLGLKRASSELEQQNITCICPVCGQSVPHEKGVPCYELKCLRCGSKMTRRF